MIKQDALCKIWGQNTKLLFSVIVYIAGLKPENPLKIICRSSPKVCRGINFSFQHTWMFSLLWCIIYLVNTSHIKLFKLILWVVLLGFHTGWAKKSKPQTFVHTFAKYSPIFNVLDALIQTTWFKHPSLKTSFEKVLEKLLISVHQWKTFDTPLHCSNWPNANLLYLLIADLTAWWCK